MHRNQQIDAERMHDRAQIFGLAFDTHCKIYLSSPTRHPFFASRNGWCESRQLPVMKSVSVASPSLVFFVCGVAFVLVWNLVRDLHYMRPLPKQRLDPPGDAPPVPMMIIADDMPYSGVTAESHRAYAERYGYRLVVQRQWRGTSIRPEHRLAARTQKLLACSHARGERFVLVLDADVVIGPWTPPIHIAADPGSKIGILDEDQPNAVVRGAAEKYKLRGRRPRNDPWKYYSNFGQLKPKHGVLNTGMLLVQPKEHCAWLHAVYYGKQAQQWFSKRRTHYNQPVLGAELMKASNYKLMPHAWNRAWVL